jgi:hypothetical protein
MRRPLVLPWLTIAALSLVGAACIIAQRSLPPVWATQQEQAPETPHPSSQAVKNDLTEIIDAQLKAFRAGDFAKAYGFAAQSIQDMFPPADFAAMVKTGYPVIAHSAKADFGMAFDTGDEAVINVRIEDAAGRSGEFQYLLKKESGVWKISGVSELKPTGIAV